MMKREMVFVLGVFLAAFVGGTAIIAHNRSTPTYPAPLGSPPQPLHATAVPPVQSPTAIHADEKRTAPPPRDESPEKGARPRENARRLDENAIAKAIVEENASWLFQHDGNGRPILDAGGKRKLSPLGKAYSHYIGVAEQNGIKGSINQHAWAVTKLSEDIKRSQQPAERPSLRVRNPLATLESCFILAEDKQYLGKITWNKFDSESVVNEFGSHGSKFSSTSIFNQFGNYGGEIALYSPFNSLAVNPPKIFTQDGAFVAYLTVNKLKSPRIDPHVLVAFLKSR
jgi:hypothetical protein